MSKLRKPVLGDHGAAAVSYADAGEVGTQETFWRFERMFRGNFVGFAIWFN